MKFSYYAPTKVYFGSIDFNNLRTEINKYGKKILILSGGDATTNIAKQIMLALGANYSIELFNGIVSNPLTSVIEDIAVKAMIPDIILSVGGGSVHDSAKALSILFTHNGRVEDFTTDGSISVSGISDKTLPIITIPTISGSGAEVSPASLIRVKDKKRVIFSPNIYPKATFIDPKYAATTSREVCINTALDALVQGIESYVSINSQDFSKRYSLTAIKRVIESLINLDSPANSPYALEQIALASIESLYAVGQSTVGAVHAISDPLSGIFNLHHGEAVAFLLPFVIEINYPYAENQYEDIKAIFNTMLEIKTATLHESIFEFYKRIGFDYKIIAKKLKTNNIHCYMEQCIKDSYNNDMEGNPYNLDDFDIEKILNKALGNRL